MIGFPDDPDHLVQIKENCAKTYQDMEPCFDPVQLKIQFFPDGFESEIQPFLE